MKIRTELIPSNVGIRGPKSPRLLNPLGVCWHWTANKNRGANAESHRKYFHNATEGSHDVIDDKEVIHMVPYNEIVWHAGPSRLLKPEIKKKYPKGPNSSLIGVELCVQKGYNHEALFENAVTWGVKLCLEFNFNPMTDFVRHYDCTGKDCPRFWTPLENGGEEAWEKFKEEVERNLVETCSVYLNYKPIGEGLLKEGRSYLPVRILTEAIDQEIKAGAKGVYVERWDEATKTVYLKTRG